MKNVSKIRTVLAAIVVFAVIGAMQQALNIRPLPSQSASVVYAAAETEQPTHEPAAPANTPVITAPEGVEVSVTTASPSRHRTPATQTHTSPKPAVAQPAPLPAADPTPAPSVPAPIPETIIVNLQTPLFYTLRPGERSEALEHLMIDGKRYEWRSGQATFWQNETPDPALPVWSVIHQDKPTEPYVSDRVPFSVVAAPDAAPGTYTSKIIIVLKEGITMGIPIEVTVTNSAKPVPQQAPSKQTITVERS